MKRSEIALLAPLAVLVFWFGLYPLPFLKLLSGPVEQILVQLATKGGLP